MEDQYVVDLYVESRYRVNRKRIKKATVAELGKQGIHGAIEVSIAVVGDRKMRYLHKTYKGLDKTTNILSFPLSEGGAMVMPTDILRLGDIILSYPQVVRESAEDEMFVDDKIDSLVQHGLRHLLGIHHE